jgi:hypothetical protein
VAEVSGYVGGSGSVFECDWQWGYVDYGGVLSSAGVMGWSGLHGWQWGVHISISGFGGLSLRSM